MPTYQYACTECDHAFDQVQTFSDDSLTVCPRCEGRLRKVFNAVGVVFKGSGFYRTDSRVDAGGAKGPDKGSDTGSETGKGADKVAQAGSEKKSEKGSEKGSGKGPEKGTSPAASPAPRTGNGSAGNTSSSPAA